MKKKLLLLFLALCIGTSLSACSGEDKHENDTKQTAVSSTTTIDKDKTSDSEENSKKDTEDSGSTDDNSDIDDNDKKNEQDKISDNTKELEEKPEEKTKELTAFERLFKNKVIPAQDKDGMWGYIDNSGEWEISPAFANARAFWDSGLALVQDAGTQLWGIIDSSGKYTAEPTFSSVADRFSDDLFLVCVPEQGYGYINEAGDFVIEPQFSDAQDFAEGFARVSGSTQSMGDDSVYYYKLWGYIDTSGKRITEDMFFEAYDFSEGLACVKQGENGYYGYIDETGAFSIPANYDRATSFRDDRAFVCNKSPETYDETWALIDKDGTWLASGWFDVSTTSGYCTFWNHDMTPVRLKDGTGDVYINRNGERVLPESGKAYGKAYRFSEDYAQVVDLDSSLFGYINLSGEWVIPPQYFGAGDFTNGLAYVLIAEGSDLTSSSGWIIDTSGSCILEAESVGSLRTPDRIAVTCKNGDGTAGKTGFWSAEDDLVIDYIFDEAKDFAEDYSYAKVKYNGLWGIIDKDGNWLLPAEFQML